MPDARLSTSFSSVLLLLTMSSMMPITNAKEAVKVSLENSLLSPLNVTPFGIHDLMYFVYGGREGTS